MLGTSVCYGNPITITIDTSPLMGGAFSLAFDLIDGDAAVNNKVTIRNFQLGGGSLSGSPILAGGAAGSLPGIATLHDSSFFNEFFQEFIPGSRLSFALDFTRNFAGGTPDSIAFFIIDNITGLPIPTLDPLGTDAFLTLDLNPVSSLIGTFASDPSRTSLIIAAPAVSAVPEPSTMTLFATGCIGLFLAMRRTRLQGKTIQG